MAGGPVVFSGGLFLALVALADVSSAQSSPIPDVPVSTVVVGREVIQFADTSSDVVFVLRDVDTPDTPIESAYIALGTPGTDVRARPTGTLNTRADGRARLARHDSASLEVVVLRIGYSPMRFTLRLANRCRQTVEVYMSKEIRFMERPSPPATPARVVLTTCTPP